MIFLGFITSLLDDIHVILGHIPYLPRSFGDCLFVHTVLIEMMSLVMTFLGFHHVFVRCHTGAYPLYVEIIWRWLVCVDSFHQEDDLHYDISGRCHHEAYFPIF